MQQVVEHLCGGGGFGWRALLQDGDHPPTHKLQVPGCTCGQQVLLGFNGLAGIVVRIVV